MKLFFCAHCSDVVMLIHEWRFCMCGNSAGRYVDHINAEIAGHHAVPLGFANSSFDFALKHRPKSGNGQNFSAFVIPDKCHTVKKVRKRKQPKGPK